MLNFIICFTKTSSGQTQEQLSLKEMRFLSAGEDGEPIPPPEPEPIDEEAVSRCLLFLPQQQQQQQLALAASATKPHSWH